MKTEEEIMKKLKFMRLVYLVLGVVLLLVLFLATLSVFNTLGETIQGFILLGSAGFMNGIILSLVYLKIFSYKHWVRIIEIAKERHGTLRLSVLKQEMNFSEDRLKGFMKDLVRMNVAEERVKEKTWVIPAFKTLKTSVSKTTKEK